MLSTHFSNYLFTLFSYSIPNLGETKIQIDDNHKTEIESYLVELRDLLTDTPIIDNKTVEKSNLPVQVKNNIIYQMHVSMKLNQGLIN